jgi:hypothetical protein
MKTKPSIIVYKRGNGYWKVVLVIDNKNILVSTKYNMILKTSRMNLGKQFLTTTPRYRPENVLNNAIELYKL